MPVEDPIDALLDGYGRSELGAAARERHLDAHPLPVDEAEVQAAAARLLARVEAASASPAPVVEQAAPRGAAGGGWPVIGAVLSLAAAVLLVARVVAPPEQQTVAAEAHGGQAVLLAPHAAPAARFPVELRVASALPPTPAVTIGVADARSEVTLVTDGAVRLPDGREVPAGHWVLTARAEDGSTHTTVLRDGERPTLPADVWAGTDVDRQLRAVRWRAMPERTLNTLDELMKEVP